MEWYAAAVGLVLAFGAWCILRVRAEYLQDARLSSLTIVAVWVLYTAHFGITLVAAATSRWAVPVNLAVARVAGVLVLGVGALLFVGGIVSFRSFRRMSGLDNSCLVTTGAYRWSRNPQNVGWAVFLAGIALVGRSGLALLMAALFWATFRAYVPAEEKFLKRTFGEAYLDYSASTHRYLGLPGGPAVLNHMKVAGVKRKLLFALVFLLVFVALFYFVYRPWQLTWGATTDEVNRSMPGDEIVTTPSFNATRAVTVDAPPERIWPWIVQIGYRRAGFYSWDLLDNDGIASADRIMAEYQGLKVGDIVPLSRDSGARVAEMEPPSHLLLVFQADTAATWAWGLYPIDSKRTRLVTRLRVRTHTLRAQLMLDAFEIVMMRKHLLGIKWRAERQEQRS